MSRHPNDLARWLQQGGAMKAAESRAFASLPWSEDAVQLRRIEAITALR